MQKRYIETAKKIVIKAGSAVIADENGLDTSMIAAVSRGLAHITSMGRKVVLVSSGAVAAGRGRLPMHRASKTIPEKQALAAVGQGRLMHAYEEAFDRFGIPVAQVLLTRDALVSRPRYLNARNTLKTLLKWEVLPIINENDTMATEELQFTDNDALAALVVNLMEADLLICLSDIDGLYDRDPRKSMDARPIKVVERVDDDILRLAGSSPGRAGRGGMRSKLEAARIVTACGIPMIVAGGRTPDVLERLFAGEEVGTLFKPQRRRRIYGRKPWIALALPREGVIWLDNGAVMAILEQGKSLLPVGIEAVEGGFAAGACVICRDQTGRDIAIGICNYGSGDLLKIIGCRSKEICGITGQNGTDEVIHRDNLVVL
ncbi:glutamate 5-kinase [Dissulfurimicrobium hydrothermale]|uniref:glutamate 5-kinase n=1 Tax=Dissulfurimicrobium hydrothermale TaxID=1750598 RepID=UPI001EDBAB67|nr:glutamate 5-kinase [Dissulfurimicrobium hydrothermale]UKL14141.1 glutamate 5-kinase [Dissulfurimicrobium hydrothermale]